jgi:DNA-directed RNA polymerase alpha subunit
LYPDDTPLQRLIDEAVFSTRAISVIATYNCRTIADLRNVGFWQIWCTPNVGRKTLKEIAEVVGGFHTEETAEYLRAPWWVKRYAPPQPQLYPPRTHP